MDSVETPRNADAGPSQPRPSDPQTTNITVLANRRFPVPPSYYVEFTPERWKRYQRTRTDGAKNNISGKGKGKASGDAPGTGGFDMHVDQEPVGQSPVRADVEDLAIFQPPRIDWIKREDSWTAFGRLYQVSAMFMSC